MKIFLTAQLSDLQPLKTWKTWELHRQLFKLSIHYEIPEIRLHEQQRLTKTTETISKIVQLHPCCQHRDIPVQVTLFFNIMKNEMDTANHFRSFQISTAKLKISGDIYHCSTVLKVVSTHKSRT